MQPDRILSYASDGLTAALYRGRYAPPSDRIVIILGGSDGSYALTQTYAAVFAENGLTALAVPYWGQPHLAQGLAQIAVETVETAVRRAQRRKHVSGWKTSKARCCCFLPKMTPCGLHTKPRGASSAVWKTAASSIPSSNAPTTARGITCFRWKAAGTNCLPTPAVTRRTTWPPLATLWRRHLTFSTAGNRAKAV